MEDKGKEKPITRTKKQICARCKVKGLEKGGRTIFCLDCNELFRKEVEDALSGS